MKTAQLAIQCTTHSGQTGDFLFDGMTGDKYHNFRFNPVSPVFGGLVELFAWCKANNWKKHGCSEPAEYTNSTLADVQP